MTNWEKLIHVVTVVKQPLLSAPATKLFSKGVLAGICISIGAFFMMILKTSGYDPLLYSAAFSTGLFLVVILHAELFTGNCLLLGFDLSSTNMTSANAIALLIIEYILNFIGCLFSAVVVMLLPTEVKTSIAEVAANKCIDDRFLLVLKGFLCNVLVCIAILASSYSVHSSRSIDILVAVLLPVTLFVFSGFEHSIANMFFLSVGFFEGSVNILQVFTNLFYVTIGNILGGIIVGMLYSDSL